jgi:hypothetical protein
VTRNLARRADVTREQLSAISQSADRADGGICFLLIRVNLRNLRIPL